MKQNKHWMKLLMVVSVLLILTGCEEITFDRGDVNYSFKASPFAEHDYKPVGGFSEGHNLMVLLASETAGYTPGDQGIRIDIKNIDPDDMLKTYTYPDSVLAIVDEYGDPLISERDPQTQVTLTAVDEIGGRIQGTFSAVLDNGQVVINGFFDVKRISTDSM